MPLFTIKIIGIIAMLIDHIGIFFFPDLPIFRIIGRIAFPIFAWGIANGAHYTKNFNHYLLRVLLFALLSQIPFYLAFRLVNYPGATLNILFTFFIGLSVIYLIRKSTNKIMWGIFTVIGAAIATIINSDYQAIGVISIVMFYLLADHKVLSLVLQELLLNYHIVSSILLYFTGYLSFTKSIYYIKAFYLGLFYFFPLFIIFFYNGKIGKRLKYLFYIIYPLQFLVIILVKKYGLQIQN